MDAALTTLRKAGLRYEEALAAERLGRWRCEHGAADGGPPAGGRAAAVRGMGADRDIARICQIMRQNGVPIPYPWRGGRPSHGQTFSSREQEVALLAAAGKTNQEIATELFLSRRTVESHVSSALRKLGLLSRKELRGLTAFLPEPAWLDGRLSPGSVLSCQSRTRSPRGSRAGAAPGQQAEAAASLRHGLDAS